MYRALLLLLWSLFFLSPVWAQDPPAPEEEAEQEAEEEAEEEGEEAERPPKTGPEQVHIGVHVNDIQTLDLRENAYMMDFYLWFRWTDPEMDPATTMEFLNSFESWGHMVTPNYEEPRELENGELYQVLHVQGKFSKKLPLYNYPYDQQTLVVTFEDSVSETSELKYIVDAEGVSLNKALILPGYQLGSPSLVVDDHAYDTRFGDVELTQNSVYSRATVQIPLSRPALPYSIKLLIPVISVILCAALMFLLSPTYVESRVDVGITSLLTIVALQMAYNDNLPDVGYLMLMDKVHLCAYAFVLGGLAVVVQTTRMVERGQTALAVSLHRKALAGLFTVWTVAMLVLIREALNKG